MCPNYNEIVCMLLLEFEGDIPYFTADIIMDAIGFTKNGNEAFVAAIYSTCFCHSAEWTGQG